MSSEIQNESLPTTIKPTDSDPWALLRRLFRVFITVAAIVLVIALAWSSMVFVDEGEYVIVERFGEIVAVYDRPEDRGLNFKLPWPVDNTRRFDRRVRLFKPPAREVLTADKKNITVAAYICWKIAEPEENDSTGFADRPVVRYYRNLAGPSVADARLDSRVRSLLNTKLVQTQLSELLAVEDSQVGPNGDDDGRLARIAADVRQRLETGREGEPAFTEELGIEIVDLRIRRINFPTGNRQAVYDRMRSERKQEVDRITAEGTAAFKAIRSRADLLYEQVLAHARADAERIRGSAEAEAIASRNAAHSKDPEFYVALRTLQTYKKILNDKTTLVLSASSSLLKMLTDGIPPSENNESKNPASQGKNNTKPPD